MSEEHSENMAHGSEKQSSGKKARGGRQSSEQMAHGKPLEDLFYNTLRDIYYAERKILKALPKMAEGAQSPELRAAFEKHKSQTEEQINRLKQVFQMIGKPADTKKCQAINGILEEGEEIMEDFEDTAALDAGLISSAQAVEHYEITRYGTLKRWAEVLDMKDAVRLLDTTLREEHETDIHLTEIADRMANPKAKEPTQQAAQ